MPCAAVLGRLNNIFPALFDIPGCLSWKSGSDIHPTDPQLEPPFSGQCRDLMTRKSNIYCPQRKSMIVYSKMFQRPRSHWLEL